MEFEKDSLDKLDLELELPPHLFRQVLDASGVALSIRSVDLRPMFANKAFTDFYGYTIEELQTLSLEGVLPKQTSTLYSETVIPRIHGGQSWEGEYLIRTKAARDFRVWGRFDPVLNRSGEVTHVISIMRDASASQQLRKALAQTERHLQFITENTSDCLFRLRLTDGCYDYISPAVESITGYAPEDFYARPGVFLELIPEDWVSTYEAWWSEFMEGESRYIYESPLMHRDGTTRWINQRITVVTGENECPVAIEGILTDATEQRQAEEALKESERKYRLLTEAIEDVIWTMDDDLNYTYVSPAVEGLLGFTPEEYQQMNAVDTMTPESMETVDRVQAERKAAEANGDFSTVNRFEVERWCKDGSTRWVETITRRLFSTDGEPIGYLGISRDISPRKKVESAVVENEARFRTLFEDSPISLWEEDLTRLKAYFDELAERGVTNFRSYFYEHPDELGKCASLVDVVSVNRATLDLLKAKSKEDLLGNLDKVLTESSMAAFTEEMILLASGGCEYCGEITHRTLEGEIIWVVVHFSVPPEYQDTLSRVIVSLLDVTPRKRAEQALMESEERYRVLVENAQEGVVVTQDGETRFINEGMSEILGYTTRELQEIHPLEMAHPEDKTMALDQLQSFVLGRKKDGFASFRVVTKCGEVKWLTLNVKPIRWGGDKAQLEILSDVTPYKVLEAELLSAHAEMEDRVHKRTAELSEANMQLHNEIMEREKAQDQILSLTQQLIRIQEDERQRIARDLHDNVAQDLSSIVLKLETLFDGHEDVPPGIYERGASIAEVTRGAVAVVRDIAYGLRPPALDQLGLVNALRNHCESVGRRSGLDIDFSAVGIDGLVMDPDVEINIYRMVQEALNNVAKHAHASKGAVRVIKSHPDILLRIEDNGEGFDVEGRVAEAAVEKRMGIKSMEERARLIGGTMDLQSRQGVGTRIVFRIPIEKVRR